MSDNFKKDEYSLLPYQTRASEFAIQNRRVILALPAGSGKTLTSEYTIDTTFPKNRRIIFVTEKIVIDDILESMEQFFRVDTFLPWSTIGYGPDERQYWYAEFLKGTIDTIVTTYSIMRNDLQYLNTLMRHLTSKGVGTVLVLDESSQVKNQESINFKAGSILGSNCLMHIALTATPISSKLSDIDNIIRCLNPKGYLTREEFQRRFEISQLETENFVFKATNTKLYLNSEEDELPKRALIKGQSYFKVPWKFGKGTVLQTLVINTKRKFLINDFRSPIYLPSLRPIDVGNFSVDITPFVKFDEVETTGIAYLYVPVTRSLSGGPTRFRSVGLSITFKALGKREQTIETVVSYGYEIAGSVIGYKNLSKYREITKDILFTLSNSEIGQMPPTSVIKRIYTTDRKTKQAVATVYDESGKKGFPAPVARIVTASSAPGLFLEPCILINSKIATLIEDLRTEIANEPVLIYSPYVNVLEYLSRVLGTVGIEHSIYHGRLSDEDKAKNKNAFKSGKSNILLMSSAAAKGVNLQRARSLLIFDLPFTAENYIQLAGRVRRLGSKHKRVILHIYLSESEDAVENCLYNSVMSQLNFIRMVESDLIDEDLVDKKIEGVLDPSEADKYMLTRLGYSKSYYCN